MISHTYHCNGIYVYAQIGWLAFVVCLWLVEGFWWATGNTRGKHMFLYPRVYVQPGACSRIQAADVGCGSTWLFPHYMFPRTSKDIFLTEILVYCMCLHILYIIHTYIDNFIHIPCSVSHMHTHSPRSNGGRDHSSHYRQHKPVVQGDGAVRVTSECTLTCVCLRHLYMSPLLLCCMSMHKGGWAVIPNMPPPLN